MDIPNKNKTEQEDNLFLTIFDTNLIQNIFIKLFKKYKYKLQNKLLASKIEEQEYCKKYFFAMNNFRLVCSLFNNISKQTLFNLNIYNIKFKIPYNLYLKLRCTENLVEISFEDNNMDTMLFYSCTYGFYDIISTLIEIGKVDINQQSFLDGTALICAVSNNKIKTIKELFKFKNLDINLKSDTYQITPLMKACEKGFQDIVQLFLSRNDLNLNIKNNKGQTTLIYVVVNNNENMVSLLLSQKNRIDINLKDKNQKTALDHAIKKKNQNIIKMIQNFQKD